LAFFSETEAFSIDIPWKALKPKMLALHEKGWEEQISKLNPEDKDYEKGVEGFRKVKEESLKGIEKISNGFLAEIKEDKNKASFYR
jgi:hypothetical protein